MKERYNLSRVVLGVDRNVELDTDRVGLIIAQTCEVGLYDDLALLCAVLESELRDRLNRQFDHIDVAFRDFWDTIVADELYLRVVSGQACALLDSVDQILIELEGTFYLPSVAEGLHSAHKTHQLHLELDLTDAKEQILRVLQGLLEEVESVELFGATNLCPAALLVNHLLLNEALEAREERLKQVRLLHDQLGVPLVVLDAFKFHDQAFLGTVLAHLASDLDHLEHFHAGL